MKENNTNWIFLSSGREVVCAGGDGRIPGSALSARESGQTAPERRTAFPGGFHPAENGFEKGGTTMPKGRHYLKTEPKFRADWAVFFLLFAAETAYGVWLGYFQGVLLGDAVSRTANAFYVLFCKPYRFTSMGLVWNPLPSLLQLPFAALAKLWRPFVTRGVGAAVVSALFAAWQGKTLLRTFEQLGAGRFSSLLITLLFCLNPYVFFYGANGMSEIIFTAFAMQIVCSLSLWMRRGNAGGLLSVAAGFVGMFLTRYEAIPFAAAVAFGMCVQYLSSPREKMFYDHERRGELFFYMEGSMWVTFFPLLYAVLVWVFYNWSITGNPLYFMNSGYSMSAYSDYYASYGGFAGAVGYVWARLWPFLAVFAAIVILRLADGTLLRPDFLVIAAVTLGLSVFQFFMIAKGKSGGYVRYLCYPLTLAAAWIPYQLTGMRKAAGRSAAAFLCAVLIFSGAYFAWGFQYSPLMREDTLLTVPGKSDQLADYINSNLKNDRILMDSYRTYYAIMNVDNVDNLVVSCSPDFAQAVKDPVKSGIDYLVVPEIGSYGNMDALNIAYPDLYRGGEPWCSEVASIGEFKIYKVLK